VVLRKMLSYMKRLKATIVDNTKKIKYDMIRKTYRRIKMKRLILVAFLMVCVFSLFAEVSILKVWEEDCGFILDPEEEGYTGDYFRGLSVHDDYFIVVKNGEPDNGEGPTVYFYSIDDGQPRDDLSLSMEGLPEERYAICWAVFADDGALYAANLVDAEWAPGAFKVYRWENLDADPELIYEYGPDDGLSDMRLGDSLSVRGTGDDVQILVGSSLTDEPPLLIEKVNGDWESTVVPADIMSQQIYLNEDGTFWSSRFREEVPFQKYDLETGEPIDGTAFDFDGVYDHQAIAGFTIDEEEEIMYTIGLRGDDRRIVAWTMDGVPFAESEPFEWEVPDTTGNWNGSGRLELDDEGNIYALLERSGVARFDAEYITSASTWTLFH